MWNKKQISKNRLILGLAEAQIPLLQNFDARACLGIYHQVWKSRDQANTKYGSRPKLFSNLLILEYICKKYYCVLQ